MTCATPELLVDGAELHGRDVERLAVDAIDERLAVLLALAQRGGRARRATLVSVRLTTRPVAKVPPRSVLPGFGTCTYTVTARVAGSIVGLTRATLPSNRRAVGDEVHDLAGAHGGRLARRHRGRQLQRAAPHDA